MPHRRAPSLFLADLSYTDVEGLLKSERVPVLLFPVGSTEPHGPHSPLATDPILSMGMCERAARELEADPHVRALILPPLDYGVTRVSRSFSGAVHVSEEALHGFLVDILSSLTGQGFKHIVLVNNHFEPEHVQTLHRSIDTVEEQTGALVGYLDLTRRERASRLSEEFRRAECHAGRYETSLVLADHPGLVDAEVMSSLPYVPVNMARAHAEGLKEFLEMGMERAYCGAPAEATAAEGEELYETLTAMLIEIIRDLVGGRGGRDQPGLYTRV